MAQIDTSGIEGFDSMSAEEKVSALLGYQFDDGAEKLKAAEENEKRLRAAIDKASSEAAGYKKQLNAKLSDDERKQQENDAAIKEMTERLAEYEKREKTSTAKSAFLGGGFDEAAAAEAANAFIEGDIEKLSAAIKKFRVSVEVMTKSKLMGDSPKPGGSGNGGEDHQEDDGINLAEKLGKMRADQIQKSRSILDHYTRRN